MRGVFTAGSAVFTPAASCMRIKTCKNNQANELHELAALRRLLVKKRPNSLFYGPPESKQTKRQSELKVGLQPCGNKRLCITGSG